jgi:hypothetical protein
MGKGLSEGREGCLIKIGHTFLSSFPEINFPLFWTQPYIFVVNGVMFNAGDYPLAPNVLLSSSSESGSWEEDPALLLSSMSLIFFGVIAGGNTHSTD